jgi:hypothetical protein
LRRSRTVIEAAELVVNGGRHATLRPAAPVGSEVTPEQRIQGVAAFVESDLPFQVLFAVLGMTLESGRVVHEVSRFAVDYIFWINLVMVVVAGVMVSLHRAHVQEHSAGGRAHGNGHAVGIKRITAVYLTIALVVIGAAIRLVTGS